MIKILWASDRHLRRTLTGVSAIICANLWAANVHERLAEAESLGPNPAEMRSEHCHRPFAYRC